MSVPHWGIQWLTVLSQSQILFYCLVILFWLFPPEPASSLVQKCSSRCYMQIYSIQEKHVFYPKPWLVAFITGWNCHMERRWDILRENQANPGFGHRAKNGSGCLNKLAQRLGFLGCSTVQPSTVGFGTHSASYLPFYSNLSLVPPYHLLKQLHQDSWWHA